jgi:hypothetical protein
MEGGVEFYWRREEHFNGGGHLWWRFIVLIESKNSKVWVCWQQEQWLVPFSSTAVRSTTSYEGLSSMHSSMPLGCRSAGPSCGSGNVLLTCGWCASTPILTIRAYPCTVQCLKVVALVLVVLGMVNSLVIGAPQQYLWWIFCWCSICIYVCPLRANTETKVVVCIWFMAAVGLDWTHFAFWIFKSGLTASRDTPRGCLCLNVPVRVVNNKIVSSWILLSNTIPYVMV